MLRKILVTLLALSLALRPMTVSAETSTRPTYSLTKNMTHFMPEYSVW